MCRVKVENFLGVFSLATGTIVSGIVAICFLIGYSAYLWFHYEPSLGEASVKILLFSVLYIHAFFALVCASVAKAIQMGQTNIIVLLLFIWQILMLYSLLFLVYVWYAFAEEKYLEAAGLILGFLVSCSIATYFSIIVDNYWMEIKGAVETPQQATAP